MHFWKFCVFFLLIVDSTLIIYFYFSALKILPSHLLLTVFNKKLVVLLAFVPQYKICLSKVLSIFFLTTILRNLIMICLTKVFFMFLHFEFCWISYICEFIFYHFWKIDYFITFIFYHFCQLFPAIPFSFLFLCNLLIIFFEDSKYTYINLLEVISSFIGILWISLKCISSCFLFECLYCCVFVFTRFI